MFDLGEIRMWTFRADMNDDGSVNVADVWLWIKWLYLYPGDWLIYLIGNTAAGRFLNLSAQSYGGELALGVSIVVWLCVADILLRLFLPKKSKRIRIMSEIVEDLAKRDAARRARPWYLKHLIPLYSLLVFIAIIGIVVYLYRRQLF
jgi:hypothetical protein